MEAGTPQYLEMAINNERSSSCEQGGADERRVLGTKFSLARGANWTRVEKRGQQKKRSRMVMMRGEETEGKIPIRNWHL